MRCGSYPAGAYNGVRIDMHRVRIDVRVKKIQTTGPCNNWVHDLRFSPTITNQRTMFTKPANVPSQGMMLTICRMQ